jgi:hypothetical protein
MGRAVGLHGHLLNDSPTVEQGKEGLADIRDPARDGLPRPVAASPSSFHRVRVP